MEIIVSILPLLNIINADIDKQNNNTDNGNSTYITGANVNGDVEE